MIKLTTIACLAMIVLAALTCVLVYYEIIDRIQYISAWRRQMLKDHYQIGYNIGVQEERARLSIVKEMEES